MFAKRSPFYSLFNQYFASLREKGVLNRITDSYDARRFFPDQERLFIKLDSSISKFLKIDLFVWLIKSECTFVTGKELLHNENMYSNILNT